MKQLLGIFLLLSLSTQAQPKKTVLAIFPHPDDESAIGEVLVKYANEGYNVQLIIATDGKDGTRVTKIPAGDSLGNLRKEETKCACKTIGIAAPIFLAIERLDTKIDVGKYFAEHKKMLALLKQKIDSIRPSFIITFGPDGDTHHSEHIVAGAAVTELLLREAWVEKYPLYYVAWTKDQGEKLDLGHVHQSYFNVQIAYTEKEEDLALQMKPCYKTQYTDLEIDEDYKKKKEDKTNVIHFRRFVVNKAKIKTSF